jgi:hypothetical protein
MKTVVLMPIRNERWMLRYNLPNILAWADHVIIADQHSTDGSRELYAQFPDIRVVDNDHKGHSNEVYWQLLNEARKLGDKNLIFYIDADEWVPAEMMKAELATYNYAPGTRIDMQWIHPWKSLDRYRVDGIYKNLKKRLGWIDNGSYEHVHEFVINGHTSIIPECDGPAVCLRTPLIHLQFVAWERLQWKQAWYRCSEFVAQAFSARRINNKYSHSLDTPAVQTLELPPEWRDSLSPLPLSILETPPAWQKDAVLAWINDYGIEYFEPLQIWHIPELCERFRRETGRMPHPEIYPHWFIRLNDFRNSVKYSLRSLLEK